MTARTRTDFLLLAGFCTFLFFYGLGAFGLIGADEPRYAQVAREMLERNDWITPVLSGHPWLEKPPLYYWQAMLAYSVLGVNDIAARLPSAVDATLLVMAIYFFFRKFRRGIEVDAALITASCAGIIGYARAASMDMPLTARFSVGMLAWWTWRATEKRIYLAGFYVCMALGMLAKGPVAPFLAAVVIVVFAYSARQPRLIVRTLWLPGIVLFCAVALPWYLMAQLRNPEFFREFILEHNLARFSTNLYHHPEPFWFYIPVVALALVPWIVYVVAASVDSGRVWWSERGKAPSNPERELSVFSLIWLLVPVLFFSLSKSKLPGYILPSVPAGTVLLGDFLLRRIADKQPVSKWMAIIHAVIATATIVPAALIGFIVTEHRLPVGRPMLFSGVVALVLCVAIAVTLVGRSGLRMLRFVTLIPVVLSVAAVLKLGTIAVDQKLSTRPLAIDLAGIETHRLPVAVCGASREVEYGLAFYRNQPVARYEAGNIPPQEHLLVAPTQWIDDVAKLTAGRHVSLLGHYPAQRLDYYWVSAINAKP